MTSFACRHLSMKFCFLESQASVYDDLRINDDLCRIDYIIFKLRLIILLRLRRGNKLLFRWLFFFFIHMTVIANIFHTDKFFFPVEMGYERS